MSSTALVTGAFSNTGSAVASELVARGWTVRTLTNRAPRGPLAAASLPLCFDPAHLRRAMAGVDVFVNTYWIRFPYAGETFDTAVERSRMLLDSARVAGVGRFVQVSVSNASEASRLGYYRGKARVERFVHASGLRYAIVRPTLIVGPHDVLTNNIAWFLRRFPVCVLPSGGSYRLQPVTLADVGRIVADAVDSTEDLEVDAAGPDVTSFAAYVRHLAGVIGVPRRPMLRVPPAVFLAVVDALNPFLRDTVLTREELEGLRQDLLVSRRPPLGSESALGWLRAHGARLGQRYANDTTLRFQRQAR